MLLIEGKAPEKSEGQALKGKPKKVAKTPSPEETEYHRAYPHQHEINHGKENLVKQVGKKYKKIKKVVQSQQWRGLQQGNLDFSLNRDDRDYQLPNRLFSLEQIKIRPTDSCYCGSIKTYQACCYVKGDGINLGLKTSLSLKEIQEEYHQLIETYHLTETGKYWLRKINQQEAWFSLPSNLYEDQNLEKWVAGLSKDPASLKNSVPPKNPDLVENARHYPKEMLNLARQALRRIYHQHQELIDRYVRNAEYQVVGNLKGYLTGTVEGRFKTIVKSHPSCNPDPGFDANKNKMMQGLSETTIQQLLRINYYHAWYYRSSLGPSETLDPSILHEKRLKEMRREERARTAYLKAQAERKPVEYWDLIKDRKPDFSSYPPEVFKLARQILRYIFSKCDKPSYHQDGMILNNNVAKLEDKIPTGLPMNHHKNQRNCSGCKKCQPATKYDHWIYFSSFQDLNPIYLPLKASVYLQLQLKKGSRKGSKITKSLQFNFPRSGKLVINLVTEKKKFKFLSPEEQKQILLEEFGIETLSGTLGGDWGLCNLFGIFDESSKRTSLHGRDFFKRLCEYDDRLKEITKTLTNQKQCIYRHRRYLTYQQDVTNYIKNEVNRVINVIMSIYHPARIVVENLNFQNSHLSKKMNRILRRCGIGAVKKKLKTLEEELDIEVIYVNPAYSSQECPHCHYIDKKNRKKRDVFSCLLCGYACHADVVGAKNLPVRSSDEFSCASSIYSRKEEVLHHLTGRFLNQFVRQQDGISPKDWLIRLYSKALTLVRGNPYFSEEEIKYLEGAIPASQPALVVSFERPTEITSIFPIS